MTYQLFPIGPTERVHDDFAFDQYRARSAKLADGGAGNDGAKLGHGSGGIVLLRAE